VAWKVDNPNDFVVSANIVNKPLLGFLHLHAGALHPYLPEVVKPVHVPDMEAFSTWFLART
jgi:hypothetical protein